jgi:hypothetical protein
MVWVISADLALALKKKIYLWGERLVVSIGKYV